MHDSPFGGHMGFSNGRSHRQRFDWPDIRNSVEQFIHDCTACSHVQRKNPAQSNKAPLQHIEVGEPFTFWAMDFMELIPETVHGNRYILVCEAFPTKDQKASTIACRYSFAKSI